MLNLEETTKAYIAGIFDGEGSVTLAYTSREYDTLQGKKKSWYANIQIVFSNCDFELMGKINDLLNLGSYKSEKSWGPYLKEGRPIKRIRIIQPNQVIDFVNAVIPYIISKKKRLLVAKETAEYLVKRRTESTLHKMQYTKEDFEFINGQMAKMKLFKDSTKTGRKRRVERPSNLA